MDRRAFNVYAIRDPSAYVPTLNDVGIRDRSVTRYDSVRWEIRIIELGITDDGNIGMGSIRDPCMDRDGWNLRCCVWKKR